VFDRRWESREATALPQRHRRWSRPDGRVDFGMWLDSPGAEDASHVKGNANSTSTLGLHCHFQVPHRVFEDLGRMTPAQESHWLASRRLSVFSVSSPDSSQGPRSCGFRYRTYGLLVLQPQPHPPHPSSTRTFTCTFTQGLKFTRLNKDPTQVCTKHASGEMQSLALEALGVCSAGVEPAFGVFKFFAMGCSYHTSRTTQPCLLHQSPPRHHRLAYSFCHIPLASLHSHRSCTPQQHPPTSSP
jgi:hypothetical protein